ncbi:hypothetical protein GCM10022279_09950 [Comamonas faecalis]|uniref:Uncharacterized protein n=1 Tax=Comamonas faecalis TaxID=1387849 RepID=A0ABP7QW38_9BURK
MSLLAAFNHVLNLLAPAFALASWLLLCSALAWRARLVGRWRRVWLADSAVGCAVLLAGLLLAGDDGRMATYAALVLACATSHWLGLRGWRR